MDNEIKLKPGDPGCLPHCETGPAIFFYNGHKAWCFNGIECTFDEWCDYLNLSKAKRIELKLKHG